jgi:phosphoribosyl 1,2-cyclic phosphodiesterase
MKLTFLGTRGEIAIRSRSHRRHSSLLVEHDNARIMIDCGTDRLHRLRAIAPMAIVLTHAHDDHAAGLAKGAPCPVYATAATWRVLSRLPIIDRRTMPSRKAVRIDGVRFSAVTVMHSLRAPAVGYRVSSQQRCFFYLPDVGKPPNAARALRRIGLYIGDGATVMRSMVRRKGVRWSAMPRSSSNSTGVQKRMFGGLSSPIADRRSCAPARGLRSLWLAASGESTVSRRG